MNTEEGTALDLSSGLVHKTYQVVDVSQLDLSTERRLESMGMTEGTRIMILNKKSAALLL